MTGNDVTYTVPSNFSVDRQVTINKFAPFTIPEMEHYFLMDRFWEVLVHKWVSRKDGSENPQMSSRLMRLAGIFSLFSGIPLPMGP